MPGRRRSEGLAPRAAQDRGAIGRVASWWRRRWRHWPGCSGEGGERASWWLRHQLGGAGGGRPSATRSERWSRWAAATSRARRGAAAGRRRARWRRWTGPGPELALDRSARAGRRPGVARRTLRAVVVVGTHNHAGLEIADDLAPGRGLAVDDGNNGDGRWRLQPRPTHRRWRGRGARGRSIECGHGTPAASGSPGRRTRTFNQRIQSAIAAASQGREVPPETPVGQVALPRRCHVTRLRRPRSTFATGIG